ncbi:MAG TPA: ABATE domain-containing protein, partial [Chloroflexia bacterium]|nr:ABATE domain-containing protein [Chloroflexia bacterium]
MATAHEAQHTPAVSDTRQICIHFANLVVWRASEHPVDQLTGIDMLLRFARWAGIFDDEELEFVKQRAEENPAEAQAALERARVAREAIYRTLLASANHLQAAPPDIALLNDAVAEAQAQVHLAPTGEAGRYEWRWKSETPQFDMVLWAAARSAAELLTSEELKKVKSCPGEGCAYL